MPSGRHKSRSMRRVFVRTPGSRTVLHYRQRKPAKPKCADCGKVLLGVAQGTKSVLKKLSKTQKRPERPFGGVLCSSCSRKRIIAQVRE